MAAADAANGGGDSGATAAAPDQARMKRTAEEEAERLQRTLFLGNLPVTVKAKLIKQTFSQCALFLHPDVVPNSSMGTMRHVQ